MTLAGNTAVAVFADVIGAVVVDNVSVLVRDVGSVSGVVSMEPRRNTKIWNLLPSTANTKTQ